MANRAVLLIGLDDLGNRGIVVLQVARNLVNRHVVHGNQVDDIDPSMVRQGMVFICSREEPIDLEVGVIIDFEPLLLLKMIMMIVQVLLTEGDIDTREPLLTKV